MEEDLHGPGIDARGAAFPGVNLYVELGHGRDYAWSATTANSDNIDTFAEQLCQDDFHYICKGKCLPMEKLDRTNSWTPNALDSTPPGSETLTSYRTVHGIVVARGTVRARRSRSPRALDVLPRGRLGARLLGAQRPGARCTTSQSFQRAASHINFAFNWFYVDANDIAYYQSGWYPQRAPEDLARLPDLGHRPVRLAAASTPTSTRGAAAVRRATRTSINQPYLVSWNNKQAPGWAAADDNYHYGPVFRSQLLSDTIRVD